ncbi:MAG TPA: S-layer homology domain-containing protein [Candidatus Intestinimonas stercorigallinarum]|nr:S-layer homology domain-containing protein [Candidatus Intestinimonas stercorigallinarum]
MRNLKRALSLALAMVMVLSMMVIGAGAASYDDFSDKDEIVNTEAVSVLVELGVINGKDDGSFDPTGIVTRAEMAKMICVVLNGGKDPSLGSTVNSTYTDTVGHWASGYIEYCSQLGIVAGKGDGTFDPNGTVTGSEAAKMLLVALGYKSEIEGFTGSNWAVGVNVRANQKGLYDDLDISVDAGLSRDNAAQMIYNALDANMVEYTYTEGLDGFNTTKPEENNGYYAILQVRVPTDLENVTHYQTWKADWGTAGEWSTNAELDGTNYFILVLRLDDGGSTPSDLQVQWTDADGDVIGTSTVKFDISGLTFG